MTVTPYMPPISPFVLPEAPFDKLLLNYGIQLMWRKSHPCPCTFGGPVPGSPDTNCRTCQGRGIFWDAPSAPFMGLLTWRHMSPTPDEFGATPHEVVGLLQHGEPTLTIPYTADTTGTIWAQASVYDAYVQIDASDRFHADLVVGGVQAVPYQFGLNIPATGAVTVYNTQTHQAQSVVGYTVSGASVSLPSGYVPETSFQVEFTANPVFVSVRKAGAMPQVRPFGGPAAEHLPRRFRIQTLDLWSRERQYPGGVGPQGI